MDFRERNLNNALSRWKKQHDKEASWIMSQNDICNYKARICGYLAGDGSVSIRREKLSGKVHHEIKFFPDNISLIGPYLAAFSRAYNKVPKVVKKNNFYEIKINSVVIVHDLLSLCSFGIKSWTIPKFTDDSCKTEWLRAMFDSDAYVGINYIRLKTVNENGLNAVRELLKGLKIETRLYIYKPKNYKWSVNYILDIRDFKSLERFSHVIGFNHKLKKAKLASIIMP
jgi:intein/homing endonuclease